MSQYVNKGQFEHSSSVVTTENDSYAEEYVNHNIITAQNIEHSFDMKCAHLVDDLYYNIKNTCDLNSSGILLKTNHSSMFNFHELIKNNIDLHSYYKKTLD